MVLRSRHAGRRVGVARRARGHQSIPHIDAVCASLVGTGARPYHLIGSSTGDVCRIEIQSPRNAHFRRTRAVSASAPRVLCKA
jgi:hypothetical protein